MPWGVWLEAEVVRVHVVAKPICVKMSYFMIILKQIKIKGMLEEIASHLF